MHSSARNKRRTWIEIKNPKELFKVNWNNLRIYDCAARGFFPCRRMKKKFDFNFLLLLHAMLCATRNARRKEKSRLDEEKRRKKAANNKTHTRGFV